MLDRLIPGLGGTVVLGLILVGYLLILIVTSLEDGARATMLRLLLTNAWLAGASLLLWLKRPMRLTLLVGSRRAWGSVTVTLVGLALLWPYALWWPGHPADHSLGQALVLVLLVPVAEELYFRGVLLDHLRDQMGTMGAVLPVCALFGFLHYPQGLQWVMAGLSLVLCALVLFAGSLAWGIALHILWNAAAMIRVSEPGGQRWVVAGVATGAVILVLVAGFWLRDRAAPAISVPWRPPRQPSGD